MLFPQLLRLLCFILLLSQVSCANPPLGRFGDVPKPGQPSPGRPDEQGQHP
ncbi:hypothetical protein MKX03_013885 [Papaver bracteatum]|nr:hypothetical protein MKX03_013885 [Papaver bracteatum]